MSDATDTALAALREAEKALEASKASESGSAADEKPGAAPAVAEAPVSTLLGPTVVSGG